MNIARVAGAEPHAYGTGLGDRITYIGLDVHKDGIVVAVAEGGLRGEVRGYGRIANTPAALQRLARKLGQEG